MARELEIPSEVDQSSDADEILRVWIAEGDAILTMQNLFGDNIHPWGMVLADIAIHVARMAQQRDGTSERETLLAIEDGYKGRMSEQHKISHRSLGARN